MKQFKRVWVLAFVCLAALSPAMAQDDGYLNYPPEVQTRQVPAGTVNEPGSQLLFILDTGINASARFGEDVNFGSRSVSQLDSDLDGPDFQNFISLTNSNPTDAVTVHFRYFNSNCNDILDFLVILTCNDTLLVDPFNFTIPGSSVNAGTRFFGSVTSTPIPAITARDFGDGRFLLFVTASGDPGDDDDVADWLFPNELISSTEFSALLEECPGTDPDGRGAQAGVRDNNLHILNASAMAFNYLTGFQTVAIPTGLLGGDLPAGANDLAYGFSAYSRPSVDIEFDLNFSETFGLTDGDGPHTPKRVVLSGGEFIEVNQFNLPFAGEVINFYYLRNESHAGAVFGNFFTEIVLALGGATGWTLFPIESDADDGALPDQQLVNFVSVMDDYNGSNNVTGLAFQDHSYRLDPVITFYNLTVYNNEEIPVEPDVPDVIISPPPEGQEVILVLAVICIDAWTLNFDEDIPNFVDTNLGDFSVADLFAIGGTEVQDHLASPAAADVEELGPGWVRFSRIFTLNFWTDSSGQDIFIENDTFLQPSFVNIGQQITRFEGFGISWWLSTVADTPFDF